MSGWTVENYPTDDELVGGRLAAGWVPCFLPQEPGNEWCEWFWFKGVDYELMSTDEIGGVRRLIETGALKGPPPP